MTPTLDEIFPYKEIRPTQAEMIGAIQAAVASGKHVALEGSTGMGKTISALCGILTSPKAEKRRIVYCSRTHKQMDRVIEELGALKGKIKVSGISLRGRREMCINPVVHRFTTGAADAARACETLRKLGKCEFFENMDERGDMVAELQQTIATNPTLAEELIETCRDEEFCPYEMAKGALGDVRVVAASYVYLLDPSIRPLFLRNMHADLSDLIIVLDEAHNLPDIAIELASDELTDFTIVSAIREAKEFEDDLAYQISGDVHRLLQDLADEKIGNDEDGEEIIRGKEFEEHVDHFLKEAGLKTKFSSLAETLIESGDEHILIKLREDKAPRSAIRSIGTFLAAWCETSEKTEFLHMISRTKGKGGQPTIKLEIQALDSRIITQPVIDGAYSTINMSGTLAPLEAYRDVVGLPADTVLAHYPSPFPAENVLALVVKGVTTKETFRTREMYEKMVSRIAEVVKATPANVGIFAASYNVLQGLLDAGLSKHVSKPLFTEERVTSSSKNDRLIKNFKAHAKRGGAVLLGVQGGRNGEGGDFPGDQMNAVIVVGIPYGKPTKRTETLIRYYESQFPGKGKLYGYYLPAHRRMCQAAGRAHRLVTDKAAVIFMDWRVSTAFVKPSLPSWLRDRLDVVADQPGALTKCLQNFF
ncbi:MAG: DNA repair helicase [Hadesarchaea archaeon CG08_land_8_20_14_0_20_51_8]|nr:MAG: DNA repair helicase [Hadesarchaea archaeon CG08_land_8_20_14_0_20_51_8]